MVVKAQDECIACDCLLVHRAYEESFLKALPVNQLLANQLCEDNSINDRKYTGYHIHVFQRPAHSYWERNDPLMQQSSLIMWY